MTHLLIEELRVAALAARYRGQKVEVEPGDLLTALAFAAPAVSRPLCRAERLRRLIELLGGSCAPDQQTKGVRKAAWALDPATTWPLDAAGRPSAIGRLVDELRRDGGGRSIGAISKAVKSLATGH